MTPDDISNLLQKHRELEGLISFHNWWLGLFTAIVALGIFAETLVEFWYSKEKPRTEVCITVVCSLIVLGGVIGEYIESGNVADKAGELQQAADKDVGQLFKQASEANERASEAQRETANARLEQAQIERLISGRFELEDSPQLRALSQYGPVPFFVQTTSARIAAMIFLGDSEAFDNWRAANEFAVTFKRLEMYAGWKYTRIPDDQNTEVMQGVTLLTWKRQASDNGEQRAFAAAEALRCLLIEKQRIFANHHEATVLSEYPELPKEGVLIEIGNIGAREEIAESIVLGPFADCKGPPRESP
jgi:hypothetical protein